MIDLTGARFRPAGELHGGVLSELRRNVARCANNPTSAYGELLFSLTFG